MYQEDASLEWEKLKPSTDSYKVRLAEGEYNMDYLFGISIEYYQQDGGNSSTGILWSHCTYSEAEGTPQNPCFIFIYGKLGVKSIL